MTRFGRLTVLAFFGAMLAALITAPVVMSQRIHIDIKDPFARQIPMAVAPLKALGPSGVDYGESLWRLMNGDMSFVGYFRMLPRRSFLEKPSQAGLTASTIRWQDWRLIGAQFLIKGGYKVLGSQMTVELRVFDVLRGRLIVGRRYVGSPADARQMVHRFSDEVIKAIFGERGIFSTKIAYVAGGRIMVMDFDGHNPGSVSRVGGVQGLSWSPNGSRIAFSRLTDLGTAIYVQGASGGRPRRVTGRVGGISITPAFSPKGGGLAAALSFPGGESDLYLISLTGKRLRRLTRYGGIDVSPAWSPDGGRLAFASGRAGGRQVFVMSLGGGARRISYAGSQNTDPAWSPRGDLIAFVGRGGGGSSIYVVKPDGTGVKRLGPGDTPSFSPDGRMIVYSRGGRIWVMNANGANQRPLGRASGRNPVWSPRLGR